MSTSPTCRSVCGYPISAAVPRARAYEACVASFARVTVIFLILLKFEAEWNCNAICPELNALLIKLSCGN